VGEKITWFEVEGPDAKALQDFYSQMFGWNVDANNPMNYGMVEASDAGVGGGIAASGDAGPYVTVYVEVSDLSAALKKAEELGGKTVNEPFEIPGGPTLAHFTDPAGNFIGLLKPPHQ
jgi:uncharacterized protein